MKTVYFAATAALFMFGFSFALVPIYNTYCKVTGINTSLTTREFTEQAVLARDITVELVAINNKNLPWTFYPVTSTLTLHPNEKKEIQFFAKNNSNHTMTIQAIPSFAPQNAGAYFHKMECFCFQQQTLKAGESKMMSVVFVVDRHIPEEINTFSLSYTLFDVSKSPLRKKVMAIERST